MLDAATGKAAGDSHEEGALGNRQLQWRDPLDAGKLGEGHIHELAEFCLAEQAVPGVRYPIGVTAIELLGKLYGRSGLREDQRRVFLENLVHIHMRVRPEIIAGNPSEVAFTVGERTPRAGPFFFGRVRLSEEAEDSLPYIVYSRGARGRDHELPHSERWFPSRRPGGTRS